jgi:hypothetical protein
MALFKRNTITTILILPYLYWWYYLIDWFAGHAKYPQSCGAANGALIILHLLIISVYALIMLINVILRKEESRSDYVKFLLIVIIPAILLYVGATVYAVLSNPNQPKTNLNEFK